MPTIVSRDEILKKITHYDFWRNKISPNASKLLYNLASRAPCYPSRKTLLEETTLSPDGLRTALRELEHRKIIYIKKKSRMIKTLGGAKYCNEYFFKDPAMWEVENKIRPRDLKYEFNPSASRDLGYEFGLPGVRIRPTSGTNSVHNSIKEKVSNKSTKIYIVGNALKNEYPPKKPPKTMHREKEFIEFWNDLPGVIRHSKIKAKIPWVRSGIKRRKDQGYSFEEMKDAAMNYSSVLCRKESYYTHRFSVDDFLSKESTSIFFPGEFEQRSFDLRSNVPESKSERVRRGMACNPFR